MKTCKACGEAKPVSEFYRDSKSADRLRYECKACCKASAMARAKTPEGRAYHRTYHREHKLWRRYNPKRVSSRVAWANAKYAADPAYRVKAILNAHKRRRWAEQGTLTPEQWQSIWAAYGGRCAYCSDGATAMDHVLPRAKGGTHSSDNVVPACKPCNSQKQARTPADWLKAPSSAILLTMGATFAPLKAAFTSEVYFG